MRPRAGELLVLGRATHHGSAFLKNRGNPRSGYRNRIDAPRQSHRAVASPSGLSRNRTGTLGDPGREDLYSDRICGGTWPLARLRESLRTSTDNADAGSALRK